jgi:ABC-type xylose transport system permease subunit
MTETASRAVPIDREDERLSTAVGVRGAISEALNRIRGGDVGSLPVVVGVAIIFAIFQILNSFFLSAANLVDLAADSVAVGTISIGIVLVLLVGQIDLSVGSMSGVASTILGVGMIVHGWPVWLALAVGLFAGLVTGAIYGGIYVLFSVPSFVITLAGLLALLGLQLKLLGTNGSINIPFNNFIVRFTQQMFVPRPMAYVLAAAVAVAYLVVVLARIRRRKANDLSTPSLVGAVLKFVALLVALEFICWYLNKDRGIPAPFVMFVVLVVGMNYLLTRTRWGRAVFAVGGSVEAARRAGIKVNRIYISVFVLCSLFAALGGLLSAGRLASASISSGTGDVNLDAIAAAVIGGTSLFGGRGSAYSALLGIIVIQSIASGLTLMSLDASVRYMITGGVLMVAVIVDSLARRTRAAHGRA